MRQPATGDAVAVWRNGSNAPPGHLRGSAHREFGHVSVLAVHSPPRRYWIRRDGKDSAKVPEATAS